MSESMNCIARVVRWVRERPRGLALWTMKDGAVSMEDFGALVAGAQRLLRAEKIGEGDSVLVMAAPGPRLYAATVALIGIGAVPVFVEPWMAVAKTDHVVRQVTPKAYLTAGLGRLWGLRIPSVRAIPRWLSVGDVAPGRAQDIEHVGLDPQAPSMVAFTSGTTGASKGIVRSHRYMEDAHVVLAGAIAADGAGPELCIFPGMVLFQLAAGRGALLVPHRWSPRDLARMSELPAELAAHTMACGPAFLRTLLGVPGFASLRNIVVGGALTDCALFEAALTRWPDARVRHVYGGTEAEPVAFAEAREAVASSRARGLFQTLSIGRPVAAIRAEPTEEGLWIAGPHVAGEYIGAEGENKRVKRRDPDGTLWHNMGDRIRVDAEGWWYGGRATQPAADFDLEQRIYAFLGSSASFLHRTPEGEVVLVGEGLKGRDADVRAGFPEVTRVKQAVIRRDRRHRARIDRAESWRRA